MVSPQSHRAGLGLSILAALILAACSGGPRVSSPMTTTSTQGNPVDTVTAYPPLPRPPAGSPQGCLGLKGAGLTATVANQVRQGVLAISGTAELLMLSTCPGGPVLVGLQPGQEVLAHRLWSRYGGDVSISVGLTSYDGTPGRSPRCGVVHQPSPLPMGLRVTLDLSSQYVRSGSSFDAKVVVTNDESINFSMDTGQPLQAVIVRPRNPASGGHLQRGDWRNWLWSPTIAWPVRGHPRYRWHGALRRWDRVGSSSWQIPSHRSSRP